MAVHKPPDKYINRRRAKDDGNAPSVRQRVPQIRPRRHDPAPVATHGTHGVQAGGGDGGDGGNDPYREADGDFLGGGRCGEVGGACDGEQRHDGDGENRKICCLHRQLADEAVGDTAGPIIKGMGAKIYRT